MQASSRPAGGAPQTLSAHADAYLLATAFCCSLFRLRTSVPAFRTMLAALTNTISIITVLALITSDCDAMRIHEHQMALIISECRRYSKKLRFCYPALSGVLGGQTVLCAKGA